MNGPTVLVVDDERNLAKAIKAFLEASGYEAEVAPSAEAALEAIERLRPDVIFTDVRLLGMSGIDLLRKIREFDAAIPVVVMTAFGTIEGAVEAVKLGAFDYLKKPVDLEELKLLADRARETSQLKQELSFYRRRAAQEESFGSVLGSSSVMRAVLDRARDIAALDETPPVLITGETGTGKGLVARTIHSSGPRSGHPFIDVNCTALPANLMEAELFGYERGAFTDAKESKLGLFEAAERGFIFLDEVGDLELALQGKLLRAIEDRTVRRVGGIRDRQIDVRILAATNRDIERESQSGQFRKDLYFRLAVILLRLPPLRERGDDVQVLAEHYLHQFSLKYARPGRRLSAEASQQLRDYPWPGNVRELSHVIERAVLWSREEIVGIDHLSLTMPTVQTSARADRAGVVTPDQPGGMDLGEVERTMLERALRESAGNQTKAAERLGISRDTLRYRLKKHGIQG